MLDNRRSGNIVSGAVVAAVGAASAWSALDIGEGAGGFLNPRTFPLLVGVLLLVGGGGLAIHALYDRSEAERAIEWPDRASSRRWFVGLGALVAYVALCPVLGFLSASFLFSTGLTWFLGRFNPWIAAGSGAALVAFVYVVFVRLLELTLPQGLLALLAIPL